jgi:hypothetical protein
MDKLQSELHNKGVVYCLQVVVGNLVYKWNDVKPFTKEQGGNCVCFSITSNPTIINRRKYPRLMVSNLCRITFKDSKKTFDGQLVNISANGFAFSTQEKEFFTAKDRKISVEISNFVIPSCSTLEGTIIRSTEDEGRYIVGCRMPEDNLAILEYVRQNYKEGR